MDTTSPLGLCDCVAALASALAAHVKEATLKDPILFLYLAEIGAMPMWRDVSALDQWEQRVLDFDINREIRQSMGEPLSNLAERIFELGRSDLHGVINWGRAKAEFERLRSLLLKAGVANVPDGADFNFADW